MKVVLYLCVSFLITLSAGAQVNLYVDSAVATAGLGSSWSTAFKTLRQALLVANNASTSSKYVIHVAKGTYYPPGNQSSTQRDTTFLVTRGGITIYGGYPAGGGTRNANLNQTLLSGNIGNPNDSSDNSRHIMNILNVPATADSVLLDGLSFSHGYTEYGSPWPRYHGNGAAIVAGDIYSQLEIRNCTFSNCYAQTNGGAIVFTYGNLSVISCYFIGNTVLNNRGGALYIGNARGRISGSLFDKNSSNDGGAISIEHSGSTVAGKVSIDSCNFLNNHAGNFSFGGNGGAIYEHNDSGFNYPTTISNSFFANNTAGGGGGAISSSCSKPAANANHIIRKCVFNGNRSIRSGGAINWTCLFVASSIIDSCIFMRNVAESLSYGGGIHIQSYPDGQAEISNCQFLEDSAGYGGGIYAEGLGRIDNCLFLGNVAVGFGGGARLITNDSTNISRCIFKGNRAVRGGGLQSQSTYYTRDTSVNTFDNCLFAGNLAMQGGGAVFSSIKRLFFENVTFSGDTAAFGYALMNNLADTPRMTNCIIWEGNNDSLINSRSHPAITNSIIKGGFPGIGNSSSNPLFVNPKPSGAAPDTSGDYHLTICSPAIDSGANIRNYAGVTDVEGAQRLFGPKVDKGAYEFFTLTDSVCVESTVQLGTILPGSAWVSSDTMIAVVDSNSLIFKSRGIVSITYSGSAGCPTHHNFFVKQIDTSITQSGFLLNAHQANASYQWLGCGDSYSIIPGANARSFSPAANGSYAVAITYNGCSDTSSCYAITGLGISESESKQYVIVYPNPVRGTVTVLCNQNQGPEYILIKDMSGRTVKRVEKAARRTEISVQNVATGTYLLEVSMNGQRIIRKISLLE